jgi:hypothetical protein
MITHLFGEMDLDFSQSMQKVIDKSEHIAEMCGYSVHVTPSEKKLWIFMSGSDNEQIKITYNVGELVSIERCQLNDEGEVIVPIHQVKVGSYQSIYEVE